VVFNTSNVVCGDRDHAHHVGYDDDDRFGGDGHDRHADEDHDRHDGDVLSRPCPLHHHQHLTGPPKK
jgi:hypothetical protein